MEYGIQMYSLRDMVYNDMEKALKTASEIGYKAVEFAGFGDHPATQIKEWLQKYDLKAWGSHIGPDAFASELDQIVAYHKELGCTNVGFSSMYYATKEQLEASLALVNEVNARLAKEGLTLYFHNHYWDHAPNRQNQIPFWELVTRTDIKFELDTYWAFMGGLDPVTMMEWLKDRIVFIHLKDGGGRYDGRSLGQGAAPVRRVHNKAKELGIRMIVESEGCNPTGPEEVKRCYDYLMSIGE